MEFCCPHCRGILDVTVKGEYDQPSTDGGWNPPTRQKERPTAKELANRFPPTWGQYGGMNFAFVLEKDKEYLIDCVREGSGIKGKLLQSIKAFLDQNNIAY